MSQHTVNESLQDQAISHQLHLVRLAGGTSNRLLALLASVDDDIVNKIKLGAPDDGDSWTIRRQNVILADIRAINKQIYNEVGEDLTDELTELSGYEVEFQSRRLSETLPIEFNTTRPSNALLRSAVFSRPFQGKLLREWLTDLESSEYKVIRDQIRIGIVEGDTTPQIVRRIKGTRALRFTDGTNAARQRHLNALVRTAVNHTTNAARGELFRQNQDIAKGGKVIATLDSRTTPPCRARDGDIYPVDKGPWAPYHIGCRTTWALVTKSWKELGIDLNEAPEGTRASMDGQVPESVTYNEFLKAKPAEFQDMVLGKTKGKLFRKGGLSVDKFVNRAGNELTIKQLRVTEGAAFDRAGL